VIERKALIFNIQKYNMYDGPGVRTLVFFKGCPLRCKWCSNPEGQLKQFQVLLKQSRCVGCGTCVPVCPMGIHRMTADGGHEIAPDAGCIGCRACETACPHGALAIMGEQKTISELLTVVEEDRPFYETSGGGVTLSGGEALMQAEAATGLLMACKERGLNTAVETCGYVRLEVLKKAADWTDLFLFDVKHMDSETHHELTGVRNESILSNLVWLLENKHNVKVRVPLLRRINDTQANVQQLVRFLAPYKDAKHFKGVDLLPYHKMGVNKYGQLRWEYSLTGELAPDDGAMERIVTSIKEHGIFVAVVRH
jgi:choline trimethylamine-lyase activating enzyme